MNWDAIAAIVEVAGVVAVVVTLFYLAVQIRQSTIQARRAELDASMEQSALVRMALAENPELADIWLKGLSGSKSLSENEKVRFESLVSQRFWTLFHVFDRINKGVMEETFWKGASKQLEELATKPGCIEWWRTRSDQFPDHYIAEVERVVLKAPSNQAMNSDA